MEEGCLDHLGWEVGNGNRRPLPERLHPKVRAGHFHTYAAKVVLSGVIQTKKYGLLFSWATFSYSLKDKHESETFELAT